MKRFTIIDTRYDTPAFGLEDIPEDHGQLIHLVSNEKKLVSELGVGESCTCTWMGFKNESPVRVLRIA